MENKKSLKLQMNISIGVLLVLMGCLSVFWGFVVWADDSEELLPWLLICLAGAGLYVFLVRYLIKLETALAAIASESILGNSNSWLAHWSYSSTQWRSFTDEECKGLENRHWLVGGILGGVCGIGAMAAIIPRKGWEEGLPYAVGLIIILVAFITAIVYANSIKQRKAYLEAPSPGIIVTKDTVLVSQEYPITLRDEDGLYIKSAQLIDQYNMKLLQIMVGQPAKRGEIVLEKLIPVPKGKEEEAGALCFKLLAG